MRDRIAAQPNYTFQKKTKNVCVRPDLSDVTEIAESEYNFNSATSSFKLRPGGYCHIKKCINESKNCQSDGDLARNIDNIPEEIIKHSQTLNSSQSDVEDVIYNRDKSKDRANSSLLVATIGSTDQSVINDTLERIPKNKNVNTDNLMELLAREAFQAKSNIAEVSDSGVNTGNDNKQDLGEYSEAIENTPFADNTLQRKQKECTIVSKSTSDQSNTEAINGIPISYVSVRKRNLRKKSIVIDEEVVVAPESPTYDVKAVEDFFSQHFSENKTGDLIISPTLAKKINMSGSETSDDFDQCLLANGNMNMNINKNQNMDIIECLNSIVDKVCNNFAKCTEYLEREVNATFNMDGRIKENENKEEPLYSTENLQQCKKVNDQEVPKKSQAKVKGVLKPRYSLKNQRPKSKKGTKNKLPLELVPKMSMIVEDNTETEVSITKNNTDNKVNYSADIKNNVDNSVIRRKRKLYSPKNDIMYVENKVSEKQENLKDDFNKSDDDIVVAHFKKDNTNAAMCYRELEKERQKYKRIRTQRSRCKNKAVCPKTKKLNDVFDNLKETIESEEKIMLVEKKSAKDLAIYNYTSDSEDEDFNQKKIELQKRTSTTTVASGNSIFSTRRGRAVNKVNYIEDGRESSADTNKKPNTKRKKTTKRNTTNKNTIKKLIDERMRDTEPKTLDTSFVVEKEGRNKEDESLIPLINAPEFETISEDNVVSVQKEMAKSDVEKTTPINKSKSMTQKKSRKRLAVKKEKCDDNANIELKLISDKVDEIPVSPLPGLLVEIVKDTPKLNDSIPSNMVQKLKRMCHQGGLIVIDAFNETTVTNTTQNLLSNNDRASPEMNITEEFNKIQGATLKGNANSEISQDINVVECLPMTDVQDRPRTDGSESTTKRKRSLKLKNRISSVIDFSVPKDNDENSKSNKTKEIRSKVKSQKRQTETILVHDRSMRSNSKYEDQNHQNEALNVSDVTEMKSGISIGTTGITAHGDFDEMPPSQESLKIRHLPREIVDMDASIKEYYVKLQNQVNWSNTNSSKSKDNVDTRKKNSDVISVKSSTPQKLKSKIGLRSTKDTSSSDGNDVIVLVPRMSLNEISKWLPSRKNSSTDYEDSVPNLSNDDLRKWLPSPRSSDTEDVSKKSSVTKSVQKEIFTSQNTKRKSQISPIKFFDGLSTNTKYNTRNTTKNDTLTFRNTNDSTRTLDKNLKTYITRSISEESQESASRLKESTSLKRKGVALKYYGKQRKIGIPIDVDVSSGPSASSVDDWFKRNTIAVKQGN